MSAIYTDIGISSKDHVGQIEIQRPPHNYLCPSGRSARARPVGSGRHVGSRGSGG